jgi:hypothetical protein
MRLIISSRRDHLIAETKNQSNPGHQCPDEDIDLVPAREVNAAASDDEQTSRHWD